MFGYYIYEAYTFNIYVQADCIGKYSSRSNRAYLVGLRNRRNEAYLFFFSKILRKLRIKIPKEINTEQFKIIDNQGKFGGTMQGRISYMHGICRESEEHELQITNKTDHMPK